MVWTRPEKNTIQYDRTEIEWQVVDNDYDWEDLTSDIQRTEDQRVSFQLNWRSPRLWLKFMLLLFCITLAGLWLVQSHQKSQERLYVELESSIEAEILSEPDSRWTAQDNREDFPVDNTSGHIVRRSGVMTTATQDNIEIQSVQMHHTYTLVEAVIARTTTSGAIQRYRTTRFYDYLGGNWHQVSPTPRMWGGVASLETEHIRYRFRARDRQAVETVAPQVEAFYQLGATYLGLPSEHEKLVIHVDITALLDMGAVLVEENPTITLPSPARFEVPVEISNAEFLEQMLHLVVGKHLLDRLDASMGPDRYKGERWHAIHNAVGLWLLWQIDGPLAAPSKDIIYRLITDSVVNHRSYPNIALPAGYQLCERYQTWGMTPLDVLIPVRCKESGDEIYVGGWVLRDLMPINARQYRGPGSIFQPELPTEKGAPLATVFDYILDEFGSEKLTIFLYEFSRQDWDTLIPHVFGISFTEFQSGWWDYLAEGSSP